MTENCYTPGRQQMERESEWLARKREDLRQSAIEAMKIAEQRRIRLKLEDEFKGMALSDMQPQPHPVTHKAGEIVRDAHEQERLDHNKRIKAARIQQYLDEMAQRERMEQSARCHSGMNPKQKREWENTKHGHRYDQPLGENRRYHEHRVSQGRPAYPVQRTVMNRSQQMPPPFLVPRGSLTPLFQSTPKCVKHAKKATFKYEVEELKMMNPYRRHV